MTRMETRHMALARRAAQGTALALVLAAGAAEAQTVNVANQTDLANAIGQANAGADITVVALNAGHRTVPISGALPTLTAGSLTIGGPAGGDINLTGGSFTFNRPLTLLNQESYPGAGFGGSAPLLSTSLSGSGSLTVGNATRGTEIGLSGANSYTGGTTIFGGPVTFYSNSIDFRLYYSTGMLIIANTGALPASGSIALRSGGSLGVNFALTQAVLNRLTPDSVGTIMTAGNITTSANLDFTNLPNVALGASNYTGGTVITSSTVFGTITPANNTYRLGGGDGLLIVGSALSDQGATPARLVIAGGSTRLTGVNTYTGGTQVQHGELEIDSPSNLGPGLANIEIDAGADIRLAFALDQAFLNRIAPASTGSISLPHTTNSNPLDFTNAPGVSLGGTLVFTSVLSGYNPSIYNGTITPGGNTYRLGGNGGIEIDSVLSGSNALVVGDEDGNGIVILGSANTYTGLTTIRHGAVLNLGNALNGRTGTIANTAGVINNGILIFGEVTPIAFDRQISGAGLVMQNGPAAVTITAAQSYTGQTTIQTTLKLDPGGSIAASSQVVLGSRLGSIPELDLSNGGAQTIQNLSGSGFVTLGGGATLTLRPNWAAAGLFFAPTYTGSVRGGGNLIIDGPDKMSFGGHNTNTGSTEIRNGVLGAFGANALSPSSALTIGSTGSLDLTGFDQTVASLAGAGVVVNSGVAAARLTAGGDNSSTTFSGVIGGGGGGALALTKTGTGTLTLSGANLFTGATTVSGGALAVTGSLAGPVQVDAGARLTGAGSVGALSVNGEVSPAGDGAIGALTVNGDLVFGAGGAYHVDVGSSTADRLLVTGSASLNGAVALGAGGSFTAGRYTLLTANGGLNGTFNALNGAPGTVSLAYDANNVFLDVQGGVLTTTTSTRQSLVFTAPTVTTNRVTHYSTQIIGRLQGGAPLYDQTFSAAFADPVVQGGVTAARAAITTAGGPGIVIGAPVRTASFTTSATVSSSAFTLAGTQSTTDAAVLTSGPATLTVGAISTCNVGALPSATRPTCTAGGTTVTLAQGDSNLNTNTDTVFTVAENRTDTITDTLHETYELNGQVVAVGSIHAQVESGLFDLSGRLLGRLSEGAGADSGWIDGYGFRVSQGGRREARGAAAGLVLPLGEDLTVTLGVDQGRLDIDAPAADEDGQVRLTQGGAALQVTHGRFTGSLSAIYGAGDVRTRRTIVGASAGRYDVRVAGAALDIGYAFKARAWTVRPVAGLDFVSIHTDGFTESDTLGLTVAEQTQDRVRASAGLEVGRDWGAVRLAASARYLRVLGGADRSIPVAFALAPDHVLDMTAPAEPDTALVGARARIALSAHASLSLAYDGRFGAGYTNHAGTAGLVVTW